MDWVKSIREIQKASENNHLVIFAGSGVSANSNIPTWGDLIRQIAKKIDYDMCSKCRNKKPECPLDNCYARYEFNQNDFLHIPEYYYMRDKQNYYSTIRDIISSTNKPNVIDDVIFKILPHHIITTNYDFLLESSKEINARLYSVISHDKDILLKNDSHYIIKMHGDLDKIENIVLKESDYIEYEQRHVLISTFIKSLLIDHTFLFVGYSLNDYNLKLIIGWINYYSKMYDINDRPHNFIVQTEESSEYEKKRLESTNIFIIDINSMPRQTFEKDIVTTALKDERGRRLYAYLSCIYDYDAFSNYISLTEILNEKYKVLDEYNRVSYDDLKKIYSMESVELKAQTLYFRNKEEYMKIKKVILGKSQKNKFILNIFLKTGINEIYCYDGNEREHLTKDTSKDEFFELYLDNRYSDLDTTLKDCDNLYAKLYYYNFFKFSTADIQSLISEIEKQTSDKAFISMLIYKMNYRLLKISSFLIAEQENKELRQIFNNMPYKYSNAIVHIKKMFYSMGEDYSCMGEYLNKQEKKFAPESNTFYLEDSFEQIWNLQACAYDYYFFFKGNYLLLDYLPDPNRYFSYYLKSILCSYSPHNENNIGIFTGLKTDLRPYPLGKIEIDMLVKYTKPKDFLDWLQKYKVQKIDLEDGTDIISKFTYFCKSFPKYQNIYWPDQLHCFVILLSKLSFSESERNQLAKAFAELVKVLSSQKHRTICNIFSSISFFIFNVVNFKQKSYLRKILNILINKELLDQMSGNERYRLNKMLDYLQPCTSNKIIEKISEIIEAEEDNQKKCELIFRFRLFFNKNKYKKYLKEHIKDMDIDDLFTFVMKGYIPYNGEVLNYYLKIISREVIDREASPGHYKFPDPLTFSIQYCILLKLANNPVEILKLAPYKKYSVYIEFLLDPNDFDYLKVDTSDYMWQNFFFNEEYGKILKKHKKEILTDNLRERFINNFTSTNEQKIIYGLLLDKNEIRRYPMNN